MVKRGSVPAHRLADKRARQEADREADGRRRAALEAVEKERQRLEARIAREAVEPAVGRVPGAEWVARAQQFVEAGQAAQAEVDEIIAAAKPARPRHRFELPAEDAEGTEWTLGEARAMLRQGYHVWRVQQVTGWGAKWFDDMDRDCDGFGLPIG